MRKLQKTYGYPYELMELVFGVQQFSKKGYCDIVVIVYTAGEARSYIIAEVKRFGNGIDETLVQLKSYLEAESRAFYGIATDGLELKIIDRNDEEVQGLLKYRLQFLPETKNRRLYKNLKNGKAYDYAAYMDSVEGIEVSEAGNEVLFQVHEKVAVPLIGNVAAGMPTLATKSFETPYYLPREWRYRRTKPLHLRLPATA